MNRILAPFAVTVVAVIAITPGFAQMRPTFKTPVQRTPVRTAAPTAVHASVPASSVTPQQKAASDQSMQTALTQLRSAGSAFQSGNKAETTSDMESAIHSMYQALGIYKSHRANAILASQDAYSALKRKDETRQAGQIGLQIRTAIREVNAALSVK